MSVIFDGLYSTIKPGWYRRYAGFAATFAAYGGNIILIASPPRVSWDGPNVTGMRYNPVSDLDIGQYDGDELQPGTAKDAQAMVRACARVGVRIMIDLCIHQYGIQAGCPPYIERNGDGEPDTNLAYKPATVFGYPEDHVFETSTADGVRVTYQTSLPKNYMLTLKKQCIAWLKGVFGAVKFRIDEAKDESAATLIAIGDIDPGQAVAEDWDGSNAQHRMFFAATGLTTMDFGSHYAYVAVSNGAGLDALVYMDRYCFVNPAASVIFIDNHDTDGPNGCVNFKGWFYFEAATTPAADWCAFGKDYEEYGLANLIENCMWIHTKLAAGNRVNTIVSPDILVWYRDGQGGAEQSGPGVVCGVSRDPIHTQYVWTDTPFRNCWLKNYAISGGPWVWAYEDGRACLPLPPNSWSRADNYVAYAPLGYDGPIETKEAFLQLTNPLDFSRITVRLVA